MSRQQVRLVDLVDATAIAERAGVSVATVKSWRVRHPHFPEPAAVLAIGPVWAWPDVERYLRQRRGAGRPWPA